jgi:DNA polymerase III epsilon subunit-like protein
LIVGNDNIASIGACVVGNTNDKFYIELKPFTDNFRPESVEIHGMSVEYLKENGTDIVYGLEKFKDWIKTHESPVFVGFPLAFDMAFLNQYFLKYLGKNPFGRTSAGIDIKTYAMVVLDIPFHSTNKRNLKDYIRWEGKHSHNALDDAKEQANLFEQLQKIINVRMKRNE